MIDSVLNGTGNSRFLKSAVPAGTSWADALAMLQAGTFPIDFNGINTEGFQQVGTPLNKANLLKDATAAQIGLPPTTTPDGMFQALGNTGEMHVWKKTVVNASEKPAGYTLGTETTKTLGLTKNSDSSSWAITVELASSVSVDDAGNVTLVSPSKLSVYAYNAFADSFSGKFFRMDSMGSYVTGSELANNEVYFVPTGNKLNIRADTSSSKFYLDLGMKLVTGYAKIPAGTTTTYPVSTNPNAYQEGDDAKAAGYVVGEVKSGKFRVSSSYANGSAYWNYGTSLTVSDDGTVNIANPSSVSLSGSSSSVAGNAQQMAGKYAVCTSVSDTGYEPDFPIGTVVFFPTDTLFTRLDSSCWASKYQPVTGYAAIPAGTTIEYLGKLGDKARVQVLSYVGTGTYGESNPNSLTFDFVPKAILFMYRFGNSVDPDGAMYARFVAVTALNTTYKKVWFAQLNSNGNAGYMKISEDRKTVSWYNTYGAYYQSNESGTTYVFLAIG